MHRIIFAFFCTLALPATAQERILSAQKAKGFDTVITQCVSLTRAAFANAGCDDLLIRIDPMVRAEGLKHIGLGRTEWGFGNDVFLRPPAEADIANSVYLTAYLRGSIDPPTMSVWLSLYKETAQGRLILWEDSGLGAGDQSYIANALSQGLAQKLTPVFQTLGQNREN